MSGSTGSGSTLPRPRLVTVAGITALAGCALLVVTLFGTMSSLQTTETRDAVREFLTTSPGKDLGIGVGQALDVVHAIALLSGALAATGAVLAAYTLRRHRGARIGLCVVAVPMLFTTSFVAGLLPFVVAVAAGMLWRREARDWFDGRAPRPRETPARAAAPAPPAAPPSAGASSPPAPWLPPQGPPRIPGPDAGPGAGPVSGADQQTPSPWQAPEGQAPWQAPEGDAVVPSAHPSAGRLPGATAGARPADRRPLAVTAAAVVTWVAAGLTLLLLVFLVANLVLDQGQLVSTLQDNPDIAGRGYTSDELFTALWLIAAFGIVWALAALAFAFLAVHGVRAGQVALVVSAALAGLVGLATVVAPVAAAITISLLLRRESRDWFAARSRR